MATSRRDHDLLASEDAEDFEAFYARHFDLVTHYVARRVSRPDLTIDVVAESFARALQHRTKYDPVRGPAIAWMLTIARNVLIDSVRRGQVADETRRLLRMEPLELDEVDLDVIESRGAAPVIVALDSLPADQREAIRRRILDEDPYPLIARDLGCSQHVIRQRVHRGLRTIRDHLKEQRA